MLAIPRDLLRSYNEIFGRKAIKEDGRPHYLRWLRFSLDFCAKYSKEIPERSADPAAMLGALPSYARAGAIWLASPRGR
jgi:hypothetical protein